MTVQLVGRELCFWCVESHRGCHLHDNSNVFWNDVSIRGYTGDDGFRIVDERQLINVNNQVQFTDGQFFMPPTSAAIPISSNIRFHFKKCEDPEIIRKYQVPTTPAEQPKTKSQKAEKPKKVKFKKSVSVFTMKMEKKMAAKRQEVDKEAVGKTPRRTYYSKIHKNAVKTIPTTIYTKGKKCDYSMKMFVCDVCELSFTLRHNLQVHLLAFHGDAENMTDEIVAQLKKTRPKKEFEE